MVRRVIALSVLVMALPALADASRELHLAARSGNLVEVKRLVEGGLPVDTRGHFGITALILAAQNGEAEVVRYLLDKGADPDATETFFGMTPLGAALWKGAPDYEVAKILLAGDASDRAAALDTAFRAGNVELARAAAESGPLRESEAAELRARFNALSDELQSVLDVVETEPDPPPPAYSKQELEGFAGVFEGGEAAARVETTDDGLVLDFDGSRTPLMVTGEREFSNRENGVTLTYFGRAGTVEGISLERKRLRPLRMRFAEDPVVGAIELADEVEKRPETAVVHWPGFRGSNRDGIGDGRDTPVEWNLATGEGVAWRADLPGLGNSSPVVWGDRVYVTTAVAAAGSSPLRTGMTGTGDEVEEDSEHRWLVLAYDKNSGKKLWEKEVGRGIPLTKRHVKATQANSSPATDGEHVVVVFPTAGLACLGTDGKLHWKHELGGLNAGGFNDPGLEWGFAASPIIHEGKVILQVDVHEGPYIAAWDLKTGKPLWKTERPDVAPSWSTPAVWSTPDGDELVVNASIIRGYDPQTGRELWSLGPTSIQVVASPILGHTNVLFVSSGYPPARPIYAVKPGIRGDHSIDSAEATAPLAWHRERGGAYMPTPLLYRGLLYIVHHNARIVAHDARTGDPVYRARFSAGGTMTASPVVANGRIYQGSEEGTLYVLKAGSKHEELAAHDFGEPLMATPAISEGLLLVRTPTKLIALGTKPKAEE